MEKEFVPYDLAVKLKEAGFDEPCMGVYYGDVEDIQFTLNVRETQYYAQKGYKDGVLAPTFSQAFRWFREKYGMYSHIKTSGKISVLEFTWVSNGKYGFFSKNGFETYEEAELACLDKLIEIVETKSE